MDQLDQIIAYEQGDLSREDTVRLFQSLVDNGMAWNLQGHYGRMAQRLIDDGLVFQFDDSNESEEVPSPFQVIADSNESE